MKRAGQIQGQIGRVRSRAYGGSHTVKMDLFGDSGIATTPAPLALCDRWIEACDR
jgi:hypothetical protein